MYHPLYLILTLSLKLLTLVAVNDEPYAGIRGIPATARKCSE